MVRNGATLALLAGAALAGCSPAPADHAQCKDAASAQAYVVKWQDDLAKARQDNKLTVDQVVHAQGEAYGELGLLKDSNWAAYCSHLDKVREASGF